MIEAFAKAIGAEIGCSRPIAEGEHWMERERYIGVSGTQLKADIYIALGISGQIQHMVGAADCGVILAVNKDKNAPIFKDADAGIVGDLYKVTPMLIEAIRAAKAREEMEEEALRRAEEERELARREEEERRARKQAEIDRERAMRRSVRTIRPEEEEEDDSDGLELESLDDGLDLNNLMIEAVNDEDGLAAALDALREIHRELGHKNPVAKISSEKLNKRGISAVASRLAGKDLIIEHAAGLSNAVQNELDELMERDKTGMIVVLIDTPENLEALHGNNMSLASKFQYIGADSRAQEKRQNEAALEEALLKQTEVQEKIAQEVVQGREPGSEDGFGGRTEDFREMPEARREEPPHLEQEEPVREMAAAAPAPKMAAGAPEEDDLDDSMEMELEEFAQYACKYAADIDCSITGKSMLALYERIEMMEEDGVRLTRKAAVDLIEEAADKAEKPSLGKKITGLFSSKYDKEGHLILREDNFFD